MTELNNTEMTNNALSPEIIEMRQRLSLAQKRITELKSQLESVTFWMDDLLKLARVLNEDLMKFYVPKKGEEWPSRYIMGITNYDRVLKHTREFLEKTGYEILYIAQSKIGRAQRRRCSGSGREC